MARNAKPDDPSSPELPRQIPLSATSAATYDVFGQSPVAMLIVNEQGVIVHANPAAQHLVGTDPAHILGFRPGHVLGCRDAATPHGCSRGPNCLECPLLAAFRHTLATNESIHVPRKHLQLQSQNGHSAERILSVSTASLRGDPSPPHVLLVLEDVSDRAVEEEALAESERRFRQLAENIHEVFWLTDVATRNVLYVSPTYETIWGQSREYLLHNRLSWQDAILPEDRAHVAPAFAATLEKGFSVEYRIRRPDGQIRWISDRAFLIRDAAGRPHRLAGLAEDITRHKQAQELAVRQQADFVHLARVNTMGQLSSGLAHELNQPLGAIANYAGACQKLLAQPRLPRKSLAEAVDNILVEARRAAEVITRLRALVRKKTSARKTCHARALVDEAIRLLQPYLAQTDVRIEKHIARNLPAVKVDSVQIIQVLLNLLQNSIDALAGSTMSPRHILISAECPDTQTLVLSVADNGPGIPPDHFSQLFVPFCTTKPAGLGIGLNICRTIIESHGGHIHATNRPTGGLLVEFTLPVKTPT